MFWNRKKPPPPIRTEASEHHYVFAHRALPEMCEQDPVQIFSIFASPERDKFVAWLWATVEKRLGKPIVGFDPLELSVSTFKLKGSPVIVLRMPATAVAAEAHFVGIVLRGSAQDVAPEQMATIRYFTLEHGIQLDGSPRTVMCEWAAGAHRNYGDGPAATLEDFTRAIGERL